MNRDLEDLGGSDPYELLGVPQDADTANIERAYRRMARRTHPDAGGDEESQKRLNIAREILLDPVRRSELNRRLRRDDDKITQEPSGPKPEPEPKSYEDQFSWSYGTSPDPPSPPEPEPAPKSYEDQFDWSYGTDWSPPQAPPAEPGWVQQAPVVPPMYPYRRWNGLAIASFVVAFVVWPVALVMAVRALAQVRERDERGAGLAWTAIVISCWGLLFFFAAFADAT